MDSVIIAYIKKERKNILSLLTPYTTKSLKYFFQKLLKQDLISPIDPLPEN